jgi:ApbE superfamily uncharacterized protein (UPF0280 family)
MAAVAGTIADRTADWLVGQGASKVFVNNGGDIAIRLASEETIKVGIMPRIGASSYSYCVQIACADGIGGIATSGVGGRSFTRGIADSVTVLAGSCAVADAYATFLANASYIEHPEVIQVLAGTLDPNSDIADLLVSTKVGKLPEAVIRTSLSQVASQAQTALENGRILAFAAWLQGHKVAMPEHYFR